MKHSIQHPVFGRITYEENVWTGKKIIHIGNAQLQKVNKTTFSWFNGYGYEEVKVTGGMLTGVTMTLRGQQIPVFPKPQWYEWMLSALPLLLIIIWGNNPVLCSLGPMIGGALGGALGGVAMALNLLCIRGKSVGMKLLISLATMVVTMGIGVALGFAIVMALVAAA